MKRMRTKSLIAIMLTAVMFVLGACGKFDCGAYVKACLDSQFKGEYEEYVKLTKSTKEEAEKLYNDGLDSFMAEYEALSLSDDIKGKLRQAYADLLKSAKYAVKETKEEGKTTIVVVEIEPMTCFETYEEDLTEIQSQYLADLQAKVDAGEEVPDQATMMEQMAQLIYDDLVARVSTIEYGEKITMDVRVTKGSDNVYTASETDLAAVAEAAFGM